MSTRLRSRAIWFLVSTSSCSEPGSTDDTVLVAPSQLVATVISVSEIALAWQDNTANEDGFEIERSAAGDAFSLVGTLGPNSTAYRDSGVAQASNFSYRVRAFNSRSKSAYSNTRTVATPEPRLIVQNLSDVVNGDVSSPVHLSTSPGSDGISLREAISAANASTVPYEIVFAPTLIGGMLELATPLPYIKRVGTRLIGLRSSSNTPGITLSAGESLASPTLVVAASDVSISFLRFTNLKAFRAVQVLVGPTRGGEPGPQEITNVRIEDNDFDNGPITAATGGIGIGSNPPSENIHVRGITVARNRFHHFKGDGPAIQIAARGTRPLVEAVDIVDNTFVACGFSINLVIDSGTEAVIRDTRIVRNTVLDAEISAISLEHNGAEATRSSMTRTLVTGNRFSSVKGDVQALVMWGGLNGATSNTVSSVWFHNNIVDRYAGGVFVIGGMGGSSGNRVANVHIANSTFYRTRVSVSAQSNEAAADVGNTITGLDVRNSIFWNLDPDFWNEVTPQHVSYSITTVLAYVGRTGNFSADPLFVAPETGDFWLQVSSPAIDKGTSDLAPNFDFFCRPRVGLPDLGAIESGSVQSACAAQLPGFPQVAADLLRRRILTWRELVGAPNG